MCSRCARGPGGVLERRGQTEAAVDLTRLAGLTPGGVLCEVMNPDGTMARGIELQAFCRRHELPIVTVDELADAHGRRPPRDQRRLRRNKGSDPVVRVR